MQVDSDFHLRRYLHADLCRQLELMGVAPSSLGPVRLWLGALSPRFMPVLLCRVAYALQRSGWPPLAKLFSLINFVVFGIEISVRCPIGPGLFFPHTQGTVIGAWSVGRNATIFQGVTLGARELDFSYLDTSRPVLDDDVTIGAGAKVLGGLRIGSRTRVGANSVVLQSLPADATAVGAPARVVAARTP